MKTTLLSQKRWSVLIALLLLSLFTIEAATKRIYCKMEHSWWTKDGAAVAIYVWNQATPVVWPGIRMTPVDGVPNVWYADVDVDLYPNCIFARVSGSGAISDWGAKTKNLQFAADKDYYVISSSVAVWGDPGTDGSWGTYTVPTSVEPVISHALVAVANGVVKAVFEGEQQISVYNSAGALLMQQVAVGSFIKELPVGLYIIHIGSEIHKIRVTR